MPRKLEHLAPGGVMAEQLAESQRLAVLTPVPGRPPAPIRDGRDERRGGDEPLEVPEVPPLPGLRGKRSGRVRVCHLISDRGDTCWCFTVTRRAIEAFFAGQPLSSEGATFPDGLPVVPKGVEPSTVHFRCGTCGVADVLCVALRFFAV